MNGKVMFWISHTIASDPIYGQTCTPFSVLKLSTGPTVGSNGIVGEIQYLRKM